ncbi:MAG: hypothetical protein ACPGGL_09705, partial [Phycisphaerales bacterium]
CGKSPHVVTIDLMLHAAEPFFSASVLHPFIRVVLCGLFFTGLFSLICFESKYGMGEMCSMESVL